MPNNTEWKPIPSKEAEYAANRGKVASVPHTIQIKTRGLWVLAVRIYCTTNVSYRNNYGDFIVQTCDGKRYTRNVADKDKTWREAT
jgi:hypothetical protein